MTAPRHTVLRICGSGRDTGVRWSDDDGKEGKMGYVIS